MNLQKKGVKSLPSASSLYVNCAQRSDLAWRFEESDKLSEIKQPLICINSLPHQGKKLKMLNYLIKKRFHSSNILHEGPFLFLNRPLNKLLNVQNRQVFYARKKSFFFTLSMTRPCLLDKMMTFNGVSQAKDRMSVSTHSTPARLG